MTSTDAYAGKRAARLLRVSSRGQDEDNQDQPTRDYITGNGMTEAREPYKLHGLSATKGQQVEAIRQAIQDAENGLFEVLVIRAVDRLDRRGVLAGWRLIGELIDAGITVHSVADPELAHIDDDTYPMAGTMVSMKLDLARAEVKSEIRRIDDTFDRMDANGSFRGPIPAGYASVGDKYAKQLTAHPYAGPIVIQAFIESAGGKSTPKIARTFKAANDRYNRGMPEGARKLRLPVTPDGVRNMLRHEVYSTGRFPIQRHDGTVYVYKAPPLVSPAQQATAVAGLESRRTGDNVSSRRIDHEDYSGALWCGSCGCERPMYRYYGGGRPLADGSPRPKVRRYVCKASTGGCGKTVNADEADATLDAMMAADVMPWWVPFTDDPNADRDRSLVAVIQALKDLPNLGLDEDDEDARRAELRAERKRLQAIADQPAVTYARVKTDEDGRGLTQGDHWKLMTPAERRDSLTAAGSDFPFARLEDGRVIVELRPSDTEAA